MEHFDTRQLAKTPVVGAKLDFFNATVEVTKVDATSVTIRWKSTSGKVTHDTLRRVVSWPYYLRDLATRGARLISLPSAKTSETAGT